MSTRQCRHGAPPEPVESVLSNSSWRVEAKQSRRRRMPQPAARDVSRRQQAAEQTEGSQRTARSSSGRWNCSTSDQASFATRRRTTARNNQNDSAPVAA